MCENFLFPKRMFVCFMRFAAEQKVACTPFCHRWKKKTFPVWPAALRMPTDESKARCGADKEGLMPTSEKKPSDSHRWWFARLAGTQREKTKMAPRRYDNMAVLCGNLGTSWGTAAQRRKKGKEEKNTLEKKGGWNWESASFTLWSRRKECYFVFARRVSRLKKFKHNSKKSKPKLRQICEKYHCLNQS